MLETVWNGLIVYNMLCACSLSREGSCELEYTTWEGRTQTTVVFSLSAYTLPVISLEITSEM